jgi:hypothetical protein
MENHNLENSEAEVCDDMEEFFKYSVANFNPEDG